MRMNSSHPSAAEPADHDWVGEEEVGADVGGVKGEFVHVCLGVPL
jgi:hypothetical protein